MICYKDMTFCASDCINASCFRHDSHTLGNVHNLPVAYADFASTCEEYRDPLASKCHDTAKQARADRG